MLLPWQTYKQRLSKDPLLAIFDRDGTLVPINADPSAAHVEPQVRQLLLELSASDNVVAGILSARSCAKLSEDFGNQSLILAGNYGLEIDFPQRPKFVHATAQAALARINEVKLLLEKETSPDWQTILEDHGLTLCWHFHLTPESRRQSVHAMLEKIKREFPDLLFHYLPTSYEIWPMITWDKAQGFAEIVRGLNKPETNWTYLFVGDSLKDEPAFDWVNERGGISLRVGTQAPTGAQQTLNSPEDLKDLVQQIIRWRQQD